MILKEYPLIKKNIKLFLSYSKSTLAKDDNTKYSLNNDGAKLIKEFNGEKSFKEILIKVLNKEIQEIQNEEMNNINLFLNDLKNKDFLDILKYPMPRKLEVRGNLENITPLVVTIELTDKCNFKCRYCYGDCSINKNKFLADPVKLLSYLDNIGVYGVELSGGEPLYHPQIYDILKFLINNFEIKGILTNGTLIREKHLNILKKNEVGKITFQICLDGSNEESVDKSAGAKGAFKRIIEGINLVKKYGFPFRVGMVVDSPDKINEIEDALLLARTLGANLFVASPLLNFGRGRVIANNFTPEDNIRLFNEIQKMQLKYKGYFQAIEDVKSFEKAKNCGLGSKNITIKVNGDLKPCPASNYNFNIGKWNELYIERVQETLKLLVNLDKPNFKDCEDCNFINYCSGCIVKGIDKILELNDRCLWFIKNKEVLSKIMGIH